MTCKKPSDDFWQHGHHIDSLPIENNAPGHHFAQVEEPLSCEPHTIPLNEQVEILHIILWADEHYKQWLQAVWDSDAIEGKVYLDHAEGARMIREQAKIHNMTDITKQKLATIIKALRVVLRRYGIDPKTRKANILPLE